MTNEVEVWKSSKYPECGIEPLIPAIQSDDYTFPVKNIQWFPTNERALQHR